jgi:hypothetical protein
LNTLILEELSNVYDLMAGDEDIFALSITSLDTQKGTRAFLEKHKPRYTGKSNE